MTVEGLDSGASVVGIDSGNIFEDTPLVGVGF
jgi:hypothetical protein